MEKFLIDYGIPTGTVSAIMR